MGTSALAGIPAPAPHELRRERLLEILHHHRDRPLILLAAPAGFGKSTLAAAYARDSGAVAAWLTLTAGDRDSRVFFTRLRDTLETSFGEDDFFVDLDRALHQGAQGVGLARALLADLGRAPDGFMLVLDDFQEVQESHEVRESVDAIVRALPEMGQLVITGRETPPLSITRLVASDAVFALGADDLRFTPDETVALRGALGGEATHDGDAEGWVAGILLGGAPRQLGLAGGDLLGAYVERQVLARLRPSEQRWLESLSVVDTITPAAAEKVVGAGPWAPRLARLAQRCPFLVPVEVGGYRLHALIRATLLNRLRRGSPVRATRAWTAARTLAEAAFDTAGVVRACQELGHTEDAIELVQRSVDEATRAGRWGAALATLGLVPVAIRRANLWLSLAEAHAQVMMGYPEPAREAAEAALQQSGRSGDVAGQVAAILELANVARYTGAVDAAEDWLSSANHLLLQAALGPQERRLLEGRLYGLKGVCLAVRGQYADARVALENGEHLLSLFPSSRDLATLQRNLGVLCARAGDYARGQEILTSACSNLRVVGDRTALAHAQNALGTLYLRTGDLESAGSALGAALDASRRAGALRIESLVWASLGDWHRASGRIGDAAAAFDESLHLAEEVAERESVVEALRLRAEVAVVQEDLATARTLLARAQADAQRLGSDFQTAGVERALGRLHMAEGATQRAITHLEEALRRGAEAWGPAEKLVAEYWLGTAYLRLGRVREAEKALATVIPLAQATGGASVLAGPAAEDPRLLSHGVQAGFDPAFLGAVERLVSMRQPWSGVQNRAPVELISRNELPRIEARLLGSLQIYRDGQLIELGPRRVDRARELFALLALNRQGLSDQEITSALWPDMAPERALHNLQMATYTLRRLLGNKATVSYGANTYRLAPQMELWVDTQAFDMAVERSRTGPQVETEAMLRRAVELYRGPLLVGASWDWAAPFRQRYESRFVASALRLAELLAVSAPRESDRLAEEILETEPENGAAYERLIANARSRGDAAAALRLSRRYQRLVEKLGSPPRPRLLGVAP